MMSGISGKELRVAYKDKEKEYLNKKKWRGENKEKCKSRHQIYYEKNKERIKPLHKAYQEENKKKRKEYADLCRKENAEKLRESSRRSYLKNRVACREAHKRYYGKNKKRCQERNRENEMKVKYGMTRLDYINVLLKQNNKCAICGRDWAEGERFHIDHCHNSKKVRGILCHQCNCGIGMLRDSSELCLKGALYLEEHK